MNAENLDRKDSKPADIAIACNFYDWLYAHQELFGRLNFAGKNFGSFDLRFLEPYFDNMTLLKYNHRYLDPAPFYLTAEDEEGLPSLQQCCERSISCKDKIVPHTALEDSILVADLLLERWPK